MEHTLSPLLSFEEFKVLLETQNPVIIDAGSGDAAFVRYKSEHIEGSHYVDLNIDLADVPLDSAYGGRHPVPDPEKFSVLLGNLGIGADSHVVVYDDKNGSNAAARFWWMLFATGHCKVQVLSGGLQKAKADGIRLTHIIPHVDKKTPYPFSQWNLPIKNIADVREAITRDDYLIIDVRDSERYLGITEPLDPVAGHIPTAINIPFKHNLDENGVFLATDALQNLYKPFLEGFDEKNVIVHCGSGVTACHTLLAMYSAGFRIPSLYVGSWSEWCRNL